MQISRLLVLFILAFTLAACSQGSGSAPSPASPTSPDDGGGEVPITNNGESVFKYGEERQSANGWTVQYDSADFVDTQTLANGWTAEVMYE